MRLKFLVPTAIALAVFLASVQPLAAGHGGGGGGGGHGGGYGGGRGGYGYGHGYGSGHRGFYGGYGYGFGIGVGFYPGYPYGDLGYGYYPPYVAYPVPVPVPVPAVPAMPGPKVLPVPPVDDPAVSAAAASKDGLYYAASNTASSTSARLRVLLPADAQLWLGDELMSPTGKERVFASPALTPGKAYTYQVKALWTQDGRPVEQSAKVKVYANKTTTVEFRAPSVSED